MSSLFLPSPMASDWGQLSDDDLSSPVFVGPLPPEVADAEGQYWTVQADSLEQMDAACIAGGSRIASARTTEQFNQVAGACDNTNGLCYVGLKYDPTSNAWAWLDGSPYDSDFAVSHLWATNARQPDDPINQPCVAFNMYMYNWTLGIEVGGTDPQWHDLPCPNGGLILGVPTSGVCGPVTSCSGVLPNDEAANHFTQDCSGVTASGQQCTLTYSNGFSNGHVICTVDGAYAVQPAQAFDSQNRATFTSTSQPSIEASAGSLQMGLLTITALYTCTSVLSRVFSNNSRDSI